MVRVVLLRLWLRTELQMLFLKALFKSQHTLNQLVSKEKPPTKLPTDGFNQTKIKTFELI
tara:strand:+ start:1076 stop:1255 length:180 start_codon:yes stop_codon:yes gene_type:complete